MKPLVSVVIPVYNDARYIRESIVSALNQDYQNLEVIVVDDGSTDSTPEILKKFNNKIRNIRQENRGTAAALNKGIKNANGQLIAWLSSDDLFLPKKIGHQVEKFFENPLLEIIYTDYIVIDSKGEEIKIVRCPLPHKDRFVLEMLKNNFVNGSSVIIRRECFEKVGFFDETLAIDSDGDMWFRMLKNGCRFGHIPIPLLKYRWHEGNLSHRYKLAESCKDRVRIKVLQTYSTHELFGDFSKDKKNAVNYAYKDLALILARQWLFRSATLAMTKSMGHGFHFKGHSLRLIFLILRTEPLSTLILICRKLRFGFLRNFIKNKKMEIKR